MKATARKSVFIILPLFLLLTIFGCSYDDEKIESKSNIISFINGTISEYDDENITIYAPDGKEYTFKIDKGTKFTNRDFLNIGKKIDITFEGSLQVDEKVQKSKTFSLSVSNK